MRTLRRLTIMALALAAPSLAVGIFMPGQYGAKLVGSGLVILGGCALAALWIWFRREKVDKEQDEREVAIESASTSFAFWSMAIALEAYYAWRFSIVGPDEPSFWLVVVLWGSFASAYIYNRVRT